MVFLGRGRLDEQCREWATRIGSLRGWRRNLAAFLCGVAAALTLAPFFFFPLVIPAFTGLLWLIADAPSRKRAFWDGWWWGWGCHITGLRWLDISLMVKVGSLWWLIPAGLLGLTAYLAIFSGMACWLTAWAAARGWRRCLIFSFMWAVMEYMRGSIVADFPWNLTGYAFGVSDVALQLASVIGVYGLTWLAPLLGGSLAVLGDKAACVKEGVRFVVGVWAGFALCLGGGAWRLHQADHVADFERYVAGVRLNLVQPDIDTHRHWYPELQRDILQKQVELIREARGTEGAYLIFPETALPFMLEEDKGLPPALVESIAEGQIVLAGTDRSEGKGASWKMWNSLVAFGHGGKLVGVYDMAKLVPWAEFVPFRRLFSATWLRPVVKARDFERGPGPRTLDLPGLPPFAPMICYEVIFPERASIPDHPPEWLLAIINDDWFGVSAEPYQHFEMARLRAVEQGLPMMIVANTGISASIDPYGRVLASLGLGQQGILDVRLPKPIVGGTFYGRYGEWFLYVVFSGTVLLVARQRIRAVAINK